MSQYRPLAAVVLAAGEGTRMRSGMAKVLHPLCGRSMVLHVVDALAELPLERIVVVVGHDAEHVTKTLQEQLVTEVPVEFVEQRVQRGTGDAVSVALTLFDDLDAEDDILVLPADAPLVRAETIAKLATEHRVEDAAAAVLTAVVPEPFGLGRVIRDKDGRVARVVEHADATGEEREINEINTSIYCFRRSLLAPALRRLSPENVQGEYYLTDAIAVLRDAGHKVIALTAEVESDVRVLTGTILEGRTVFGTGSVIGPDTRLTDVVVGERTRVLNSVARESEIGDDCEIGPFAYLRPGTRLANGVKVGTYVEVKNSEIGEGTKVPHLSYIGDADVGADANLGASTITANYDGAHKHRTTIGDGVHTGIHTSLVAPVELGDGSETGAGSVVTHDVGEGRHVRGIPARDTRPAREDEG